MSPSSRSWAVAGFLACLAAAPRVVRPDLVEYKLDEATVVLNARAIIQDHVLPLHGPASSVPGLAHSPLLYYIVAPLLALQPDPRVAVLGIALVNALAVGLAYVVVARAFGNRIALISSLLFASGSWAIIFSRKIWSIDLLAPLSVVALWGLLRAIDTKTRTPGLGRTWVALAAMVALNYSSWPLIPLAALLQLTIPRSRQGRALLWSLLGASVFLPPLVILAPSLIRIGARLASLSSGSAIDPTPFDFIVQLADPTGFLVLAGPSGDLDHQLLAARLLQPLLRALLFLGAGVSLVRAITAIVGARVAFQARARPLDATITRMDQPWSTGRLAWTPEAVVLLWWLAPAVAASYRIVPVYVHHFADTFPTQFILIALGADLVARAIAGLATRRTSFVRFSRTLPTVAGYTFAVLAALIQIGSFAIYLSFIEAHPRDTFFGTPLEYDLRAVDQTRANASGHLVVALQSGADTVGVDEGPTVLASLAEPSSIQFVDADHTLAFPDNGSATYLLQRTPDDNLDATLAPWRQPGGPIAPTATDLGAGYQQTEVQALGAWLPPDWHHVEVPLEGHGLIVGYSTPRQIEPGKPAQIDVAWRVGQPPSDPRSQSVFVHVVDDQGRSAVGRDFAPMPSSTWRQGETIVNRFTVTPPSDLQPGRYWVDFGRYQRPGIQPVHVTTDGKPGPASVRFGPVAVPPPSQAVPGLIPVAADFGGEIRLVGWKALENGDALEVTLAWQAEKAPPTSYTVFTHLLAPNGGIVTQHDSEPRAGQFPTSTWKPGDRITDSHVLDLKKVPAGSYRLEIGLYSATNGKRLPVGHGDAYVVGPISVRGHTAATAAPRPTPTAKPVRTGAGATPSHPIASRTATATPTPRAGQR